MKTAAPAGATPPHSNHKIQPPRAHRHAVERRALLARLFDESAARVVVFQGPAGHGKTSLMLQARARCTAQGALTGWLSIDESDNDVLRLLGHLQALVAVLGSQSPAPLRDGGAGASGAVTASSDWLIGRLLELGRPVALFLDDLHALTDPGALRLLRELVTRAPERIRWFLASRVVPEVGLPRLVVGDEALVVSAEDLRFSREEMRRVFEADRRLAVNDTELEAIFGGTEGWPAAVQLYRLALGSSSVRNSLTSGGTCTPREVADYLAENVLGQQTPRVQDFLLRTCVLPRMSAALCDAVLGRDDSQEQLAALERDGLFVRRLESGDDWFTYHALFATFLQEQLARAGPHERLAAHRRAAAWFEANGHFEEALHHHLSAGDAQRACEVFDRWSDALVPDGHFATVERWARRLPEDAAARHPGIAVKLAWAFSFLIRHDRIEPLLPVLRANLAQRVAVGEPSLALSMTAILQDNPALALDYVTHAGRRAPTSERFGDFELSASHNVRGFVAMLRGDFGAALASLARGRELSERSNATFTLAYSLVHSGITLVAQGQLPEALEHLRAAMSDRRMVLEGSVSQACLACALVMALYEADRTADALALFEQFHDMIVEASLHDYLVICYRAVARIHDLRGDAARALETLEEAERLSYNGRWPRVVQLVHGERLRRELVAGRVDRARTLAARLDEATAGDADTCVRFSEETEGPRIGRIRLDLHTGRAAEALDAIRPCLTAAQRQGRVHRQIRLETLAALAHQALGQTRAAHRSLQRALELAAPGRYLRMFLDEGPALHLLLKAHAGLPATGDDGGLEARALLERLLGSGATPAARARPAAAESAEAATATALASHAVALDPLTRREHKVLSMLADYQSNDQIASALCVSRDTVKFHVRNIYSKLGVKTRLEAIRLVKSVETTDLARSS